MRCTKIHGGHVSSTSQLRTLNHFVLDVVMNLLGECTKYTLIGG